jgi:hypothetical protein
MVEDSEIIESSRASFGCRNILKQKHLVHGPYHYLIQTRKSVQARLSCKDRLHDISNPYQDHIESRAQHHLKQKFQQNGAHKEREA